MRGRARLLVVAVVIAAGSTTTPGIAGHDCDPRSPTNWAGSCETEGNQARCGPEARTPVAVFTIGTIGVEACNDQSVVPIQGRVGADDGCFCIYADGDDDNPQQLRGWVRVDQTGARICNNSSQPSYNSGGC